MESQTRPANRNSDIAALRALRNACRDFIIVCEAGYAALTDEVIERRPDLVYLRTSLAVASGKQGTGATFGTPIEIERRLSHLPGETTEPQA